MMEKRVIGRLTVVLITVGLMMSPPSFAKDPMESARAQPQSAATGSVQKEVDKKSAGKASEKRKHIIAEATAALSETRDALTALDEKKTDKALAALEKATGKLEVILAREPGLTLAPVDVAVITHDLLADPDTVKSTIHDAEEYLEDGEVQKARPLVASLRSEILFRTTSIPLGTYPAAIKETASLIDEGKIDEARAALQVALGTLVTTDEIVPLPILRAELLLDGAEALAENKERTDKDNDTLADLLKSARTQLKLAAVLGYGAKQSFKPLYQQLDHIQEKTSGGKSGKGWFDKIKQQITDMF
jgi:YfdX protein